MRAKLGEKVNEKSYLILRITRDASSKSRCILESCEEIRASNSCRRVGTSASDSSFAWATGSSRAYLRP